MPVSAQAVARHFARLLSAPLDDLPADASARESIGRLLAGSDPDRVAGLFLVAALRTGVLSRIQGADSLRVGTNLDDTESWQPAIQVPDGTDLVVAESGWEPQRVMLVFRSDLRAESAALDRALAGVAENHANAIYLRARAVVVEAETSSDWFCALACAACSLTGVGCEACQECSGIPPHV
jgi:hypothetical protein